jgi:hypothetical protein
MDVKFRILGPLEVTGESGPISLGGPKQRGVLAILLLRANQVVPVEQLADELYDGPVPATATPQTKKGPFPGPSSMGAAGIEPTTSRV